MEMVELSANLATEILLLVMKSNKFKSMYGEKLSITPVMDQNQTSTTKELIRW